MLDLILEIERQSLLAAFEQLRDMAWDDLASIARDGYCRAGRGMVVIDNRTGEPRALYMELRELPTQRLGFDTEAALDMVRTYDPDRSAVVAWIPQMEVFRGHLWALNPEAFEALRWMVGPPLVPMGIFSDTGTTYPAAHRHA